MKRLSIRKQLITLFVPFLFGLWITSAIVSFWLVSTFSGESFDRDLISSADSVVGRLRMKEGKVVVDLPPAALAILKHHESDKFYYRVVDLSGQWISGDQEGLPPPLSDLQIDTPRVLTSRISSQTSTSTAQIRVAEIKTRVDESGGQAVIVQVAETTNVRTRFQEKMLLSIAVPQLLVIALGLFAVWYGITKILTPLRSLQLQLATRSQLELGPLADDDTPEEVYPLVRALNQLFARLRDDIKAHQRFIANAAHQLRTPLAGLKTYSSLGTEMTETDDLKHIMRELDQGIDRASRMVGQLLTLARTDRGDPLVNRARTDIDLNFLVSDVVAELAEQAIHRKIQLQYEPADDRAMLTCEPDGLRHLVANLIENAVFYTPAGGSVSIKARKGHNIVLSVCDTGPGIPAEERDKVFERFYRIVGTTGNGSGLGLSIVKEVANAHNANISIGTGNGGVGTLVTVEFLLAERAGARLNRTD